MTAEHWEKIKELFYVALERDGSQRDAFLDHVCAGDPFLRAEVGELIASHEQAGGFMAEPVLKPGPKLLADDGAESPVGQLIGPYKILREIGHGGMGTVYLAARADDEYQKQVAIKIVKRGMNTSAIIRRFRNERQILANLDHPNIAKLLDGGTTEDGLSYFVMDYIEGLPINMYCDTHKRSTVERLKLFQTVCSAVHYAHQHHVVHRDIKPGNILVTAEGVPKLLDFGIAKLLNPDSSSESKETTFSLRPMTPDYASPEQVRGEPITPASDIYSLGVLLYELLTGHRPYYYVKNREEEPKKPSAAIRRIQEVAAAEGTNRITLMPESVSEARGDPPEKLRRHLAGDLDNVVLMALRKEPERRYASVEQFSKDIQRHLEGLPVIARKDTVSYHITKFVKRNKTSVITATLASAMILALIGVGLYLLTQRKLTANTVIASLAVLPLENISRDPEQEYFADGMTEALITDLGKIGALRVISRPSVMRYRGTSKSLPEIARELNVDAVVVGSVLRSADRVRITAQLIDAKTDRQLWSESYQPDLRDILALQGEVARAIAREIRVKLTPQQQARLSTARPVNREAYEAYLKGRHFWNKRTEKDLKKGIELFQQAIEREPTYGLAYVGLADSYIMLVRYGTLPSIEGFPRGKAAALKALEIDDTLAEAHASLAHARLFYDWDWSGAEREFKRAIEINPNDVSALNWFTSYLSAMGRHDEAIARIKRAQELDPLSLIINTIVGRTFYFARQYDQAVAQCRKTLELDPNFAQAHQFLGQAYGQKGMYDEAFAALQKGITLSGDNPQMVALLGHAYAVSGKKEEALKTLDELKELSKRRYVGPYNMALVHTGLGEKDQAFEWLQKSYAERSSPLVWLAVNPEFDGLRSDPRFTDLLLRIGLKL